MKLGFKYYESSAFSRFILFQFAFFCLAIPLFSSQPFGNQDDVTKEQNLKAAFIYNFTKYVFWSDNDTSITFIISIIGESNILLPLENIANNRKVGDREITIKRIEDIDGISQSHILFISGSERDRVTDIIKKVNIKNTLTISDSEGFAQMGVAINFFYRNRKIGFEINPKAIKRAKLNVSSQLLRLAVLVDEVSL